MPNAATLGTAAWLNEFQCRSLGARAGVALGQRPHIKSLADLTGEYSSSGSTLRITENGYELYANVCAGKPKQFSLRTPPELAT